jgi:hypothetical protein
VDVGEDDVVPAQERVFRRQDLLDLGNEGRGAVDVLARFEDRGSGGREVVVADAGHSPGVFLNEDLMPRGHEFTHLGGQEGDASFLGFDFGGYAYFHQ